MNGKVAVVAVKTSKEIPKSGLVWALTHIVQPGDCIKLLVVVPHKSSGKNVWNFARISGNCAHGHRKSLSGTLLDQRDDISDSCSELLLDLQGLYDPDKIKMRVKVVLESPTGVVATEARKVQANWVILDKHLRHEKEYCLNGLDCNLVVMRRSEPKVLRLNLIESARMEPELPWSSSFPVEEDKVFEKIYDECDTLKGPSVTPVSSPEHDSMLTATDMGTSSVSSPDLGTSPFLLPETFSNQKKRNSLIAVENRSILESDSDIDIEKLVTPSTRLYFQPWLDDVLSTNSELSKYMVAAVQKHGDDSPTSTYRSMLEDLTKIDEESVAGVLNHRVELNLSKSVRDAISLSTNVPLEPPPLCTVCRHKAPEFGNPPKWFTYAELEHATDSFAEDNFLAEGGFGSVYRGVLPDGQVVAVKQHKMASSQGDQEFCSEVEVLSCAQHRNVVRLIGFCVEDGRRLLVYEYICNGSLDLHLFGCDRKPLTWSARQKIAVGAARGLRYLHEECRVGCIVHRDMRPNNILITHDFEPLVGDFGLARWQPNGDLGVDTRIIGTFGYLAPEYAQSGQITEKADVYSFGVVLVELITGRKAIDINRPKGQQCLTEWARPLLENQSIDELIDPRLSNCYNDQELHRMLQCALLSIQRDPFTRPRMSQVLRMLEGDIILNSNTSS